MSMVNSIATMSTSISMTNARQDVSLSVLKKAMDQSKQNMSKILEISSPVSSSTVDFTI